jgi:hypothetical protein
MKISKGCMLVKVREKVSVWKRSKAAGQSAVEFALVGIFLFFMILGIIEMGRLLFVFSTVSNAAQEGSRYGIVRPRDVVPAPIATQIVQNGGRTYLNEQVVRNGNCSIWGMSKEKVVGIPRNEVDVTIWYDNGNGTPVVPNVNTPQPYRTDIIATGNRLVVEASYRFHFVSPFLQVLAPQGVDVRMTSARTIVNEGDSTAVPCFINLTPAPMPTSPPPPTASPTEPPPPSTPTIRTPTRTVTHTSTVVPNTSTATATSTNTPGPGTHTPTLPPGSITPIPSSTRTLTATPTRTLTATPTPTPGRLYITRVDAKKRPGNNRPLYVEVDVTDGTNPVTNATVIADVYVNGTLYLDDVSLPYLYGSTYQECPAGQHRNGDVVTVDFFASAPGYISASRTGVQAISGNYSCR